MGRRDIKQPDDETTKVATDHSAVLAEITAAENALAQIGLSKRRVSDEMDAIKKDIELSRLEKSKLENEVYMLKLKHDNIAKEFEQFQKETEDKKKSLLAGLPDEVKILADLETKKLPIQAEITRLSGIQFESQKSLSIVTAEYEARQKDSDLIAKQNDEAKNLLLTLNDRVEKKKAELLGLTNAIESAHAKIQEAAKANETLSTVNKTIQDAEAKHVEARNKIATAESELAAIKEKHSSTVADTDAKIKTLAILEKRVDEKIEIFKQYKEKFSVDELSKIKINTDHP
jgi:chromosome segregation ATPase